MNINKTFLLLISIIYVSNISCQSGKNEKTNPGIIVSNYLEDKDGIFCNPERGWQKTYTPDYETNAQAPNYTVDQLEKVREENITLVDKTYILAEFRDVPISEEYLANFQHDMDLIRKVGLKAVIRFAYNHRGDDLQDAPVDIVLRHIAQIKPYLQKNYDVIAFMEAGFIGDWAEWHGTTNNLLDGQWKIDINENTIKITDAIVDALPKKRMIAFRYVFHIQELLNEPDCQESPNSSYVFSENEAFSGTRKARFGRHDDWFFLDGESDGGTWSGEEDYRKCQKAYLEQRSKYVPITTGETGSISEHIKNYSPINELERFHYASLSVNPDGAAADPIRYWQQNGMFDKMARRFGYRFVLKETSIPSEVKSSDNLKFGFIVENVGFGSPYNPRVFEIVLRNKLNGKTYHFDVTFSNDHELDPRYWFRENGEMAKDVKFSLQDVPEGNYEIFMHLPDPMEALYGRSEFSIRFANLNIWDEKTGYNKLGSEISIIK